MLKEKEKENNRKITKNTNSTLKLTVTKNEISIGE